MKILIVNRFFGGAQIPTGRMAEDVGRLLAESGHEVTALASSGAYEGAAEAQDQETKRPKDQELGDRGQEPEDVSPEIAQRQTGAGGEAGVAVGQCCVEAVGTEQLKNRRTEILTHRSALCVETVAIPKWIPRALAWLWFTWQARKRIPRMDWDVCVLMTDPPLLPLLARRAARPRDKETKRQREEEPQNGNTERPPHRVTRRVAVWLMDLYPEALAASGRLSERNPVYRWYFNKRQRALAAADLLICLGHAQKELLGGGRVERGAWSVEQQADSKEQGGKGRSLTERVRTVVVPPWDDREDIVQADDRRLQNLALYAGNLGEAHTFVDLLRAVPFLPNEWKLRFAVRGAKAAALRRSVQESGASARVIVSGYVSGDETAALLASARVHLITMASGWQGIVVPSKLYGCVRTGRPVLFVGPPSSDTASEIRKHDWGECLPPSTDGREVAAAILRLAARPTTAWKAEDNAARVAGVIADLVLRTDS